MFNTSVDQNHLIQDSSFVTDAITQTFMKEAAIKRNPTALMLVKIVVPSKVKQNIQLTLDSTLGSST